MDRYVSCERRRTSVRLRKNEQFPEESEQRQTAHKKNAYFPGYTCCQSSLVETSEPSKAFLIPKRIDSDFEINTSVSRCRERQCWHFRNCTVYLSFPRKERHLETTSQAETRRPCLGKVAWFHLWRNVYCV